MPLVEIDSLVYRYPAGTPALRDVNFHLDAGERVGLVGPNGAGKSTLLWHLNGLLPEKLAGQGVRVAGESITSANIGTVRRKVGLVFQDPDDQLFCPTVREDVAFGPLNMGLPRADVERRVAESLAAVDLLGFEDRLAHHLSTGERKRVCLAGVLACQPELLALDEPTANLDPRGRRNLIGILQKLDCALLVASHDLELVLELVHRVLILDEGQIVADGPTRELLADEPLMLAHGLERPASLRDGAGQGRGVAPAEPLREPPESR